VEKGLVHVTSGQMVDFHFWYSKNVRFEYQGKKKKHPQRDAFSLDAKPLIK
jgi:hypothetical protein